MHPEGAPAANANAGATVLPSQRVAIPPPPGSDEAAFLDNLNEVYNMDEPADAPEDENGHGYPKWHPHSPADAL